MQIEKFSSVVVKMIGRVEALAASPSLWQQAAKDVLQEIKTGTGSADDVLQTLHMLQRLNKIAVAGLAADKGFYDALQKEQCPMWKDFIAPPAALDLQHSLAEKLYNIRNDKDFGYLNIGDGAREIGKYLLDKITASGAPFFVNFADPGFDALVLNHTDENGVQALAQDFVENTKQVNRIMIARPGMPVKTPPKADAAKASLYSKATSPFGRRVSSGEIFYTLTVIPTPKDAEIDGIDYNDYTKLFFEMCDQPWQQIQAAQTKLIAEFNAASKVRITNNDGTDITMSLIDHDGSHFTFCNSVIAKNVPGSEIFSAPRIDSLEGKVVAKGKFMHNHLIENLTLEFEKGKLVRYSADKGLKDFESIIGIDDGAKMVGELGIGTNPWLKQHVANGLLVEKIGGSFHLALGAAYSYTEYEGEKVKVNNGNTSDLHWDITTMLHGKEGKIYLDDRLVMDNGLWCDTQKYDVLNRGWKAIPQSKRPAYWR